MTLARSPPSSMPSGRDGSSRHHEVQSRGRAYRCCRSTSQRRRRDLNPGVTQHGSMHDCIKACRSVTRCICESREPEECVIARYSTAVKGNVRMGALYPPRARAGRIVREAKAGARQAFVRRKRSTRSREHERPERRGGAWPWCWRVLARGSFRLCGRSPADGARREPPPQFGTAVEAVDARCAERHYRCRSAVRTRAEARGCTVAGGR